ncbi:MAG: hypothetical protein JO304_18675 [Solirubrobacterales bacterium]|nr:hypothetical protein [Solirubrobacterales bacterium]
MDTARDLARMDPWRESLERSQARRATSARASARERQASPARASAAERRARPAGAQARERRARPRRRAASGPSWATAWATLEVWSERAVRTRAGLSRLGPRGVAGLALLAAIVASALASGGPQASSSPADAAVSRAVPGQSIRPPASTPRAASAPLQATKTRRRVAADKGGWASCPLAVAPAGYANPLAGAVVKPERIDQGVDYAGKGTLSALGAGHITYLATSNTGWPGAFIEYQLLDGADAGCYVFYAEGVIPMGGLRVGQTISAGQPIATIIPFYPTGIEIGWGAGISTTAYAKVAGQWRATDDQDNVASAAGKNFSALVAALGGPPGKVEG